MNINISIILKESSNRTLTRGKDRSDQNGEVFTPTTLVIEILEKLPDDTWQPGKTFLDPTCGNGQFLAAVAIVKRELGHTDYLNTLYGVDLMADNVADTKARLLAIAGDTEANRSTLERNILCRDGLTYDYGFGSSHFDSLFG